MYIVWINKNVLNWLIHVHTHGINLDTQNNYTSIKMWLLQINGILVPKETSRITIYLNIEIFYD